MRFSGREEDKLNQIYESMIVEEFIDVDKIVDIIYSKKGSAQGLGELLKDMIFVKKGRKSLTYSAKEITKRLMKAGLTKEEVGEVRTVFAESIKTAIDKVFKKHGISQKRVEIDKAWFGGYSIYKNAIDDFIMAKDDGLPEFPLEGEVMEIAEKLVRMKLKNYLAKRK